MNGGEEAGPAGEGRTKCNFEDKCVVAYGALLLRFAGFGAADRACVR